MWPADIITQLLLCSIFLYTLYGIAFYLYVTVFAPYKASLRKDRAALSNSSSADHRDTL